MMDDVEHTPGERVRAYLAARATMTMDRDAIHTMAISAGTFQLLIADLEALSTPLRDAAPDMLAEMQRYLPIIEHIERNPNFWREASRGTGLATANGYRAAIAKATGGV